MSNIEKIVNNDELTVYDTAGSKSKWGRVDCRWVEIKTIKDEKKEFTHHLYALINKETGDVYLDCTKKKIYTKFIAHALYRPIHIVAKTLYHALFFISIPHVIAQSVRQGQEQDKSGKEIGKQCLKNSLKSLADIVRTPAYGIAMLVVSAAALVIGPLAPSFLYTLRETVGRLVRSLNWQNEDQFDLFMCFQPLLNINKDNDLDMFRYDVPYTIGKTKHEADTKYPENADDKEVALINYARAQIRFRRNHRALFNDCFQKIDPNKEYQSRSYAEKKDAKTQHLVLS